MIRKIIFSDLDGTLLNENHKITFFTKTIINKLRKNPNYLFIVTTGRITKNAILMSKKLGCHKQKDGYVISNNGAQIYSFAEKKMIYNKVLKIKELKGIHDLFFDKINVDIHYYSYSSIFVYRKSVDSIFWSKIMSANYKVVNDFNDFSKLQENKEDKIVRAIVIFNKKNTQLEIENYISIINKNFPSLKLYKQTENVYEIIEKQTNKGYALKWLSNKLNVQKDDTISFGDSYNDFSLIKKAGTGIVVKNAIPELKKIADIVIEENKDGPAYYIWRKFLKKEFN